MEKEYLNKNNSKTVRLSRALISEIEDVSNSVEIGTVNDCLNEFMRPIAHALRKARSRQTEKGLKWNVSYDLTKDSSITITFSK